MSDASTTPAGTPEEPGLREDAGNPDTDRDFLADEPPTQVDDDAVRAHADSGEAGTDADAART